MKASRGSTGRWALILVTGLATGAVTQIGQSVLPDGWSQAANAISPWLIVAFLAGSSMSGRSSAMTARAAILVLALIGYYATTQIRYWHRRRDRLVGAMGDCRDSRRTDLRFSRSGVAHRPARRKVDRTRTPRSRRHG